MHTKFPRTALVIAGAMVASAVLVALPSATAQGQPGSFTATFAITGITAPSAALAPDGLAGQISVQWKYSVPNEAVTANGVLAGSTALNFNPAPTCSSPGFIITGPTTIPITIPATGPSTSPAPISDTTKFNIVATSDAPGETPVQCTFNAYVDQWGQNNMVPKAVAAPQAVSVQAAYLGLVSANVPVTIDEAGPQKQINYAIHLTNLGNSRTFVNFAVVDTHSADNWQPVAPTQISLESKNQGGTATTTDANFLISTPYHNGWNNKETTFQLTIQPQSTKNPQLTGNTVTVNFLARVRGIYVPGPEPMLLVAVLVGAVLVARVRRGA